MNSLEVMLKTMKMAKSPILDVRILKGTRDRNDDLGILHLSLNISDWPLGKLLSIAYNILCRINWKQNNCWYFETYFEPKSLDLEILNDFSHFITVNSSLSKYDSICKLASDFSVFKI